MSKLAYGLVAGLLIGSAFSDGFRQSLRDLAARATRAAVTIVQEVREGAVAGADEARSVADCLHDDSALDSGNVLDRLDLVEKPALARELPAQQAEKPVPAPALEVTQVPAGKKTR